jgi:Fe-S cluster assembly protein SufD
MGFATSWRAALPSIAAPPNAVPFVPSADTLEAAIAYLDLAGTSSGSAVDATARRTAFSAYAALPVPGGYPGRSWRYDYAKLPFDDLRWSSGRQSVATMPFAPSQTHDPELDRPALATENAGGLVHLGATLLEAPGPTASDPRVIVTSLAAARRDHAELLAPVLHAIVDPHGDRFAALATAFQNCGAFVYVPAGVVLDAPIQLLFVNGDAHRAAVFPLIAIVLGAGARATVIERHSGDGDAFVCGIVEAHVGAAAQLDVVTIQQADVEARIFASRGARCERDATMRWHLAELGGALARSVVTTELAAPGARGEAAALFFTGATQHVDLTVHTEHTVGQTTSNTVVRSAATDHGQGRFFGNIAIRKAAHGSDASLRDDALLLSKSAHIDSVPALEIAANDVKAFHGATVGSVDEEQLFYARSRGIGRADALRMIALGFFEPVVSRFPGERLRDEIRTALDGKIDAATEID